MRNILDKLKSKNGESLAEVLIAILITGIAVLMVSSMIFAATKIIANGESKMADIYNGINVMEEKSSNAISGKSVSLRTTESPAGTLISTISVTVYEDEKSGLISYKKAEVANP